MGQREALLKDWLYSKKGFIEKGFIEKIVKFGQNCENWSKL